MIQSTEPLAVQISNVSSHPVVAGRTGLWTLSLLVVGLVLVARDVADVVRARRWRLKAVHVHGLVVDNLPEPAPNRPRRWRSLVEFEASGQRVIAVLTGPRDLVLKPLDRPIEILYHPSDPRRIEPAGAVRSVSVWLVVGLALVVFAVVL